MRKLFLVLLGIFLISSVYAAGCCFDQSVGTCSKNVERDSCSNGNFYDDATCNSVSDCNAGCCVLGNNVDFITPPSCYFKAQANGLVENFQPGTQDKCTKLQSKQNEGACIVTGRYSDKTCKYTVQSSCGVGQFFEGVLCSDVSIKNQFNVTCTKTKNTMCYNEDAYFVDSCGNPDVKKQDCDYNKGTICSINKTTASCKSLDCVDDKGVNRKNGESWCYYSGSKTNYFNIADATSEENQASAWVEESVGSEFYRKFCLNGKVEVEACAGMRQEVCDIGKCVKNPWQDCLLAGNETKDCNPKFCFMFNGHPGCGIIRAGETVVGGLSGTSAISNAFNPTVTSVGGSQMGSAFAPTSSGGVSGKTLTSGSGSTGMCSFDDDCSADRYCFMGACTPRSALAILSFAKLLTGNVVKNTNTITGNVVSGSTTALVDTPFCKGHNGEIMTSDTELNNMGFTKDKREMPEFRPQIREDMIKSAGMATCMPSFAGGFMYEKQIGETSDSTACSTYGSLSTEVKIKIDSTNPGFWGGTFGGSGHSWHAFLPSESLLGSVYGLGGIMWLDPTGWVTTDSGLQFSGKNTFDEKSLKISVESYFIESFNTRCRKTTDCAGQINYLGQGGGGENILSTLTSGDSIVSKCTLSSDSYSCPISFQCMPYEAPIEGNCKECQADPQYPCTAYKCASIGSNCEFIDDLGVDKSVCMPSNDLKEPKILSSSLSPKSPIQPFSSVQINLTTDEVSFCKFQMGSGGSKYADMPNNFGSSWGTNHSIVLNIPGKFKENVSDEEIQYEFLTRDGKYNIYVRCSDPKTNWNLEPYLIKFEVMQTPDSVPAAVLNFTPKSGNPIEFNTTTKLISFKLNEPAECKWDLNDTNFSSMNNSFSCDLSVYSRGVLKGYGCSGTLTNISAGVGKETKFYIRCKDQPWLEGNETQFYKRNINDKSVVYSLKNSDKLIITEVAPKGSLTIGPSVSNFSLNVRTAGGAESGKAQCKWKLGFGSQFFSWQNFSITNSNVHKQVLTNKTAGDYNIYTECTDIAGNKVNSSDNLILRVDTESPTIGRIFNNKGSLEIYTSESSVCKFTSSNDLSGCSFSILSANLTLMNSKDMLKHSATWTKGKTYYIKCQDLYGNVNSVCNVIGKAV